RRWGRRPWPELLGAAIRLADEGFVVSHYLAGAFVADGAALLDDAEARRIFDRDGALPREGDVVVQRDLAATLRRVAEGGAAGFYAGPVAEALVRGVRARGGVLALEDLGAYRPVLRAPLIGRYRGYRIVAFPPPSSGGLALLQILGMLEGYDLRRSGSGSSRTVHLMVEAERRAFADRARWLGDPEFVEIPLAGLLRPDYLARRAASIRASRATPSRRIAAGTPIPGGGGGETLHLSVGDADGGAVALTTTLNTSFGTGSVADGTGVLLNNEIDDFALAPGIPNVYGLVGDAANAIAGGKRPLSSMSPTIVEDAGGTGRPRLVLGSPGGAHIITAVAQVVIDVLDHGMTLQEAVDAPRFHHQWLPDRIEVERGGLAADVERILLARGYHLEVARRGLGDVAVIGSDGSGGWLGAADPRREGVARGY
ncbi:MAG TPA: gamma-glutamyltransferase, partial [Candidatus Polarisedimenticolaceae bacterium]|nr:gamma-glutamyltransferase [Candidatus Polarisedimenticolaceae bacterium]